jgi:hypothetical protein
VQPERLLELLAMLPWEQHEGRLFPPERLRVHLGDADAEKLSYLSEVADGLTDALGHEEITAARLRLTSMRVLVTFEPIDAAFARLVGELLIGTSAWRLWIQEILTTAWSIVSSDLGSQRLAGLRHTHQRKQLTTVETSRHPRRVGTGRSATLSICGSSTTDRVHVQPFVSCSSGAPSAATDNINRRQGTTLVPTGHPCCRRSDGNP